MNLAFDVSCFLVFNFYVFIIIGQGDLHHMIRKSMYAGVMNNLFGKNVLPVNNQVYSVYSGLDWIFVKEPIYFHK